MIKINDMANWFLSKEPMTHKKLQKLCYYGTAWCHALIDDFDTDTKFEAWVHGPVSPELYSRFKGNLWNDLPQPDSVPSFPDKIADMLENVWFTYGSMSANALEALSHRELPWQEARAGCPSDVSCSTQLNIDTMKRFYRGIYISEEEA